ncbi:nitroreductase family protein [Sphingobacterium endophyticum]|uniref:nitroreductase family protein n=1 Tax=Sphingobacterium endophyticum TaxID=2546448 RepID=UPI0012E1E4D0|nr:nitroreductase family protein [Sphingobacterium endophyticum]
MKNIIKKILGENLFNKLVKIYLWVRNLLGLIHNFLIDFIFYFKYSTVFSRRNFNKIESQIILDYHSVEKGLLFYRKKVRFAKNRIISLNRNLNKDIVKNNSFKSQIQVAYKIMCEYYEFHLSEGVDIQNYFNERQYSYYKSVLGERYDSKFSGAIEYSKDDFYLKNSSDFYDFSFSRRSVRSFTGKLIPVSKISEAIKLAGNSPSVCNRQASKVYLVQDKDKIEKMLKIQGGFTGYSDNVGQLLILTTDRNYFYTVGERNQFYIDGGIFLMNLLYSLHFYKIGNCPANWGKTIVDEKKFNELIKISPSEKIICLIPIGEITDEFKICLSERREIEEYFIID